MLNNYETVEFFSSGSTILDLALGGGWGGGRIFNIVGDKSTGKTLLAIEAFANFGAKFPGSRKRYGEAEAAFDTQFAEQLGFPNDVTRPDNRLETVEDFYEDIDKFAKDPGPGLYILDSLDALSDRTEMKQKIDEATYGAVKAKQMSQFFRRLVSTLSKQRITLAIISQIRDTMDVGFGDNFSRSGGRALDFYASQVVYLAHTGQVKRTHHEIERVTGVAIKAKVKKNKVGNPFREAEFNILFGYGIDDETSMIDWLAWSNIFNKEQKAEQIKRLKRAREGTGNGSVPDYNELGALHNELQARTTREWMLLEEALKPKIRKYGNPIPAEAQHLFKPRV